MVMPQGIIGSKSKVEFESDVKMARLSKGPRLAIAKVQTFGSERWMWKHSGVQKYHHLWVLESLKARKVGRPDVKARREESEMKIPGTLLTIGGYIKSLTYSIRMI
jgi:hypothetical protein